MCRREIEDEVHSLPTLDEPKTVICVYHRCARSTRRSAYVRPCLYCSLGEAGYVQRHRNHAVRIRSAELRINDSLGAELCIRRCQAAGLKRQSNRVEELLV